MSMKGLPKFAIALEYDGKQAPLVTARGHDEIANQILRLAQESGVPIHLDKDLALVLEQIDIGEHIPEALYLVIAEILTFAYRVSGKHKDFMDDIRMQSQEQKEPPPAPENG
jgi:flagellar biosynthesis protein